MKTFIFLFGLVFLIGCSSGTKSVHVYEVYEIVLNTENDYDNPYTDVECWVTLQKDDISKKVYGFWNGGDEFVVRVVATEPGEWRWTSESTPADAGLQASGTFTAIPWSDDAIAENPNRRGFLRATENGHALQYADGEPFFMVGDTWWAASTWRFPFKGERPDPDYVPAEGIGFEEAVSFRKQQDYNTIAMIAAYPNWQVDEYPAQYINEDSIGVRQAWEKNGMPTAKDMHDEAGNRPFEPLDSLEIVADFNRINPAYFESLDTKIEYLSDQGFVTFLETIRRDHGPSWKAYFDWPESFARYVQYIIARYGAYNIIFSGIHLDWINEKFSLSADEFNKALTYHYEKYGPLPFGQPHSILIDGSTYEQFGHGDEAPWLNMHAVGNVPRNHGFYPMIETLFNLEPPYPAANLEPYYPGWDNEFHNTVAGERPEPDSERDHYFGRAQMYGSVLSGGLAGHVYGTGAYDGNTTGESWTKGERPYIWTALNYESGAQMQHLNTFMLSEGGAFQSCSPQRELLMPYKTPGAPENGLDGWAYFLANSERTLGFTYFENDCEAPKIGELVADADYELLWFDPINGKWLESQTVSTNQYGVLQIDAFPGGETRSSRDWCLKIKQQ